MSQKTMSKELCSGCPLYNFDICSGEIPPSECVSRLADQAFLLAEIRGKFEPAYEAFADAAFHPMVTGRKSFLRANDRAETALGYADSNLGEMQEAVTTQFGKALAEIAGDR